MPDDLHARLAIAQRREAALAGVLRVVANSGGDLSQLMHGIAENARLLCAADVAGLFMFEGDHIAFIGSREGQNLAATPAAAEDSILTRVLRERVVVRFDDQSTITDEAYAYSRKVAADVGFKSAVYVPVPGEGEAVGINALRGTITPFTDDEVELLQAFAVQVGNALDAAKQRRQIEQRNTELTAALTLQAATSEVLRLISTNPGDLSVVLDGILAKAADLCGADGGTVMVRRGDVVRAEAALGPFANLRGLSTPPARVTLQARDQRAAVLIDDAQQDDDPIMSPLAWYFGLRSFVSVPLFHDEEWIGNINLSRFEVRPFDPAQVAILQSFADQAAIAVSNARLFNDLDDSLARQQAMTDLLDAVSTARTDLQPVFDVLADRANRLCSGTGAGLAIREGDALVSVAAAGALAPAAERRTAVPIDDETIMGAAALHQRLIHIPNWDDEPASRYPTSASRLAGRMSALTIPMIRNDVVLGVVGFSREAPGGYTDAEISLLKTFVDQAAIAVDNARLLVEIEQRNNELAESLARQTAMTELLDVVSTARFDLQPVFDTLAGHANRLCKGTGAAVFVRDGDVMRGVASDSFRPDGQPVQPVLNLPIDRSSPTGEAALTGQIVHIADWDALPTGSYPASPLHSYGVKSGLAVPMLRNGVVVGAVAFVRAEVNGFSPSDVTLLQTFANQAAIAVDNARLLQEIEQRNNELAESLELQTATSEVLQLISDNPGDLQAVFDGIVVQAARLCDATAASISRHEGDEGVLISVSDRTNAGDLGYRFPLGPPHTRSRLLLIDDVSRRLVVGPGSRQIYSCATAPLIVDDRVYGHLTLSRYEVRPFDARHGRIAQAFAEQASIAIANAKLFNELAESLELQTAASEVLQLISDNPGDLEAVFDGIVTQAARLCDADGAAMMRCVDDEFEFVAISGEGRVDTGRRLPKRRGVDYTEPRFVDDVSGLSAAAGLDGASRVRSLLSAPMFVDREHYGQINVTRFEVRPFEPRHARVVGAFAEQAAIAVANARLFSAARGADPNRRGGQRREGLVPRHDEPRDPYADERRDRDERAAARHRAVLRASASSPRSSARAASHCSASSTTSSTSRRSTPAASSSRPTPSTCGLASSRPSTS